MSLSPAFTIFLLNLKKASQSWNRTWTKLHQFFEALIDRWRTDCIAQTNFRFLVNKPNFIQCYKFSELIYGFGCVNQQNHAIKCQNRTRFNQSLEKHQKNRKHFGYAFKTNKLNFSLQYDSFVRKIDSNGSHSEALNAAFKISIVKEGVSSLIKNIPSLSHMLQAKTNEFHRNNDRIKTLLQTRADIIIQHLK